MLHRMFRRRKTRVWEPGFRVQGSGFRVQGSGFHRCPEIVAVVGFGRLHNPGSKLDNLVVAQILRNDLGFRV